MSVKKNIQTMDCFKISVSLRKNWLNLILVNLLGLSFVLIGFFMPVLSISLAIVIMACLEIGIYGYVLELKRNIKTTFEQIFLPFKTLLKSLCLKIIVYAGIIVWGLLFIIPGVIYALNNCFAKLVYYDNPNLTISEIMEKSKNLVYGKRLKVLLFALISVLIVAVGAGIGIGVWALISLITPLNEYLTALIIILFALLMLILVALPVFEMFLVSAYDASLKEELSVKESKTKKSNSGK